MLKLPPTRMWNYLKKKMVTQKLSGKLSEEIISQLENEIIFRKMKMVTYKSKLIWFTRCFQHSLFPDYNRPKDGCNTQREMTNQAVVITANSLLLILAIRSLLNSHYSHEASGYFSSCCHLDQPLFAGLVRCPNKYSSIFILPDAPYRYSTRIHKKNIARIANAVQCHN